MPTCTPTRRLKTAKKGGGMPEENRRLIDFSQLTADQTRQITYTISRAVKEAKDEQAMKDVEFLMKSLLVMVGLFVVVYGLGILCDWW